MKKLITINWTKILILLCLSSININSIASESKSLILAESIKIHSKILDEERFILIHTPKDYQQNGKNYPVLYLLDGDTHLRHVSGLTEFLAFNQLMPEVIVVAITNTDRARDLTPKPSKQNKRMPTAGGADNFIRYLSDEVMPMVEKQYRTAPYKILVGHSFGGLFAIHTQFTRPSLFNAYIAISPTLDRDDKAPVKLAKAVLKNHEPL